MKQHLTRPKELTVNLSLLSYLRKLKNEATSYKTSTSELDKVREKLVTHIDEFQKVAENSHQVINMLLKIGGPEILSSIKQLSRNMSETATNHEGKFKRLWIFIIITLATSLICLIGIVLVYLS